MCIRFRNFQNIKNSTSYIITLAYRINTNKLAYDNEGRMASSAIHTLFDVSSPVNGLKLECKSLKENMR